MAAGDPGSVKRNFSSTAVETSLVSSIGSQAQGQSNTAFIVASNSGFPSVPFTLIVDPDTSKEEVVTVTAASSTTLTVTRGEDSTQGVAHSAGAVVRHGVSGRDFREEQTHIAARGYDADSAILALASQTHVHGLVAADGSIVGTDALQTLTRKTLTSPTITNPTITGAGVDASIVFEGATADAHETTLTVVDPTADRTITLPNATGTVALVANVLALSGGTMSGAIAMGTSKITGMGDPTLAQDATTKIYVDTILGSATAAATSATSAATSATSAATSATSAATSASSALTSQTAAASSATAAATSATSAASSATAATTSATSAANSATAATTSATSAASSATAAATSATSATTSASSALTSATSASTSASSALTSANSAATSASSAATSYDEFDDRYLGSKSSDPTLDNDGGALLTGALYFNNVINAIKVYSGTAWGVVAADTNSFINKDVLTAKGTLISASTAGVPASLTVASTNGYVLAVDSATTSGLAWVAAAAGNVTLTGTETLTNKTLTSPVLGGTTITTSGNLAVQPATYILEVKGGSSTEGAIQLNCAVNTHGQVIKSQPHAQAASNTLLLPGGTTIGNSNAVLVSDTGTQTLTNKTLTSPILTTPTLGVATATSINGTTIPSSSTLVTSVTSGSTTRISIGGTTSVPTIDLSTSGVTATTYTLSTITVDAYGRITSASTGTAQGETFNPLLLMGA